MISKFLSLILIRGYTILQLLQYIYNNNCLIITHIIKYIYYITENVFLIYVKI